MKIKEVEEWELLKRDALKLELKIEMYSVYKISEIGEILARLMTAYENEKYKCVELDSWGHKKVHYLKEENDCQLSFQYKLGNFENAKHKHFFVPGANQDICFLPPSGYTKKLDADLRLYYIQDFIDYLFQERTFKNLEEISFEQLEQILNNYLELTKEKQLKRQKDRLIEIDKKQKQRLRMIFERSCMVDRKTLFDTAEYIINNYEIENGMVANQEEYEKATSDGSYFYFSLCQEFIIRRNGVPVRFKSLVDERTDEIDERDFSSLNKNKNTFVNFFEFKNTFFEMYRNSIYFSSFLDNLEKTFEEKTVLEEVEVYQAMEDALTQVPLKKLTMKN